MDTIQIKDGPKVKLAYNMQDCPHRAYCIGREGRESKMMSRHEIKLHCSFNQSMFECEFHKIFNHPLGIDLNKPIDLDFL